MYRIEINVHEKELCIKLVIYKDYEILCYFRLAGNCIINV
jgi:hypothetical protein